MFGRCAALFLALALGLCAPAAAETEDWIGLIEGQLFWYEFAPMPDAELREAVGALGGIADAYAFTGRASADGTYGYIVGLLTAGTSPLQGMAANYVCGPDGEPVYELWPADDGEWVHTGEPAYAYSGVELTYDLDAPDVIFVEPGRYAKPYGALFYLLVTGETAYLAGASARGVSVCAPPAPCLLVRYFAGGRQREEYIRLTGDDVRAAMLSSYLYTPDVVGDYALTLFTQDGLELGDQPDAGVAAPLFDLAAQRCGFTIASPEDVGEIVSATLAVTAYGETRAQTVDDPELLAQLQKMLKNAEYTGLYGCPYTGVLTLTMADGREMVVHKATDSCDTLVFGSAAGYVIGREENARFWEIFADVYPQ